MIPSDRNGGSKREGTLVGGVSTGIHLLIAVTARERSM